VHHVAGFDVGGADVMDLLIALLGPAPVRLVEGLEGCDPLYWSGHDGYKILVDRAALEVPERLHYELAFGLACWWFRELGEPELRARAVRLLAVEILHAPALAPSAVMPATRRCASDSAPSIRIKSA
jgi:hypothetical protein